MICETAREEMSELINLDDFWSHIKCKETREEQIFLTALKRKHSYLGKIPSIDFPTEAYEVYLSVASSEELDEDIVTRQTLQTIIEILGW